MLVLALIALLAVGCGGDDDDGADSGTTAQTAQTETTPGGSATTGGEDADSTNQGDDEQGGGGKNGAQGAEGALGRAAFIRRADKICAAARTELAEKGQGIAALARRAQIGKLEPDDYFRMSAKLTAESAAAGDRAVDQLEELPRPESRRDALERYLTATRDQVDYLFEQAQATRDGDQQEIARLNAVTTRTSRRVRAAATEYGFKVCGGA
jgi:hypothetical protein